MEDRRTEGRFDNPEVGHERTDVPLNGLLAFFGALIVLAVAIHVVIWLLMITLDRPGPPERGAAEPFVAEPGAPPPGPQFDRLLETGGVPIQQVNPVEEMRILRQRELATLKEWGWIETPAGLVLPVERALDALAAQGVDVVRGREAR